MHRCGCQEYVQNHEKRVPKTGTCTLCEAVPKWSNNRIATMEKITEIYFAKYSPVLLNKYHQNQFTTRTKRGFTSVVILHSNWCNTLLLYKAYSSSFDIIFCLFQCENYFTHYCKVSCKLHECVLLTVQFLCPVYLVRIFSLKSCPNKSCLSSL